MFLSIFKERTLTERLERFFMRLESGRLKGDQNGKTVWALDGIELKFEETTCDIRCYFTIDHRTIYVIHYLKEADESNMIVEREEYLIENKCLDGHFFKEKIHSFVQKRCRKNLC